jgi:membrane protease YdiL (CAAX protease family)
MSLPLVYIALLSCFALLVNQYRVAAKGGGNSLAEIASGKRDLNLLNHRHFTGLLLMLFGTVCYLSWPGANTGWLLPHINEEALWLVMVIAVGATAFSYFLGFRTLHYKRVTFSQKRADLYLLLRLLYLVVYEVFFRMVLLSAALQFTPAFAAVMINVLLYTVAHLYSSRREMLACIPLGFLWCFITLQHGSVWPVVILHLLLSLPYEAILLTRKNLQQTYAS